MVVRGDFPGEFWDQAGRRRGFFEAKMEERRDCWPRDWRGQVPVIKAVEVLNTDITSMWPRRDWQRRFGRECERKLSQGLQKEWDGR